MRTLLGLVAAGCLLAGCGGSPPAGDSFTTSTHGPPATVASPTSAASSAPDTPRVIGTVASKLAVPWGIAFLPDHSALVTERDTGRVLHVTGPGQVTEVGRINETSVHGGEAGLLGIAVSPSYARDEAVFAYVSTNTDNRIVTMTFDGKTLSAPRPILTGIPNGFVHDGGRLAFGPDGFLYASTGETGQEELAQDPKSLGGKILRITKQGKPAPGNPDPTSPVWSIGHRNVQGLAFDDHANLWASEFGASAWDELNLIQKATNYGWPEVEGTGDQERFRNPQIQWRTDDASPSGLAFLDGYLYLGALQGTRLWRVDVRGERAGNPTDFFVGKYGRLRTVVAAPDGNLWVTTSNRDGRGRPGPKDDRILLVRP
ncbi:MAG: PQQ-dependent sugar dehydrogenase [Marmoricola sp.]